MRYSKDYGGSKWNETLTVLRGRNSYCLCPVGARLRNMCNWDSKRRCNKIIQGTPNRRITDQGQALDRGWSVGKTPPGWEYPIHSHEGGQNLSEKWLLSEDQSSLISYFLLWKILTEPNLWKMVRQINICPESKVTMKKKTQDLKIL